MGSEVVSLSDVMLCCPHCRREYRVSIDLAKLARVTSRAACARCKKIFDITPDRMRGLEIPRAREARQAAAEARQAAADARRDVRVERTPGPLPMSQTAIVPSDPPAAVELPPEPVKITIRTPSAGVIEERNRAAEVSSRELAMPRTLSARLTSRTRSKEAAPPAAPAAVAAAPAVSEAPVVDPDSDWLIRADPGLAALTTNVGEGVAALQWLLER
jgi:hypothetical protein